MIFAARAKHPDEGDLLRLLDGDGETGELDRMRAHADECTRCADALGSLGRAATLVRTRLADIPAPSSDRWEGDAAPGRPALGRPVIGLRQPNDSAGGRPGSAPDARRVWLRAAVALLAVAGTFALVPPLRARIAAWFAGAGSGVPRTAVSPTPAAAPRPAGPAANGVLWFAPAGRELRVVLAARQSSGVLTIASVPGASASLAVSPADPAIAPLVSERVLEIRNSPTSRSSYQLRLPPTVRTVVLALGSEPARLLTAAELAAGVRVPVGR